MAGFDLQNYSTVNERIMQFHGEFPTGVIQSNIHTFDGEQIVFEGRIYKTREDYLAGVFINGFAHEISGSSKVNTTSFVENGETSAIGRALANAGFSVRADELRPSREEMEKVARTTDNHDADIEAILEFMATKEDYDVTVAGKSIKLRTLIKKNSEAIATQPSKAAQIVKLIMAAQEEEADDNETGVPTNDDE